MHSAVWATTRSTPHKLKAGKALLLVCLAAILALSSPIARPQDETAAEPVDAPADDNLSGPNLEAEESSEESGEASGEVAGEEDAEPVRRIQRLGDVVGKKEWKPEITVPQGKDGLPHTTRLPDEEQHQQLQKLLSELAADPEDASTINQLNALLDDVIRNANAAIAANRQDEAMALLGVVQAVDPDYPGLKETQSRLSSLGEESGLLAAARQAMEEGRVDQPENNSAWYFYRQAFDQDPANQEAADGLVAVQQHMIARALKHAEDLDFDSAERLLEDAAFVREDQVLIEQAQADIENLKTGRAQLLESRAVQAMDSGDFNTAEGILIDLVGLGGQSDLVNQLRRRLEEARVYGGFQPGQLIRDHFLTRGIWAPESVVILAGSFQMGSLPHEKGRNENEGPQHRVTFRRGFAIGRREVSVSEFRGFVSKTGHKTDAQRSGSSTIYDQYSGRLTEQDDIHWEMDFEGKPASPDDPVVHVSWNDAQAYVKWLAQGTGKSYRLPSEAEFEYALRGGRQTRYWWGDGSPSSVVENITGEGDSSRSRRQWTVAFEGYSDKFWGPAPVGSFKPNPFGLYDMGGNVGEWVRDCWHDTYVRAPMDGSAWVNPGCDQRAIRGGYWASSPDQTRSAYRLFAKPDHHDARIGFRIARDL